MKNIIKFILRLVLVLISNVVFSQTIVFDNEVSGIWSKANSPYIVLRNITVPADSILIIEPGVEIQIGTGVGLSVEGYIQAIGTDAEKIIFTSVDSSVVKQDSTCGWSGILITGEGADTSIIENCIIKYTHRANTYDNDFYGCITVDGSNANINKCIIRDNYGSFMGSIYCRNSDVRILNTFLSNNSIVTGYSSMGIYIYNSRALVANNVLLENVYQGGINTYADKTNPDTVLIINNTIILNNRNGLRISSCPAIIQNCIIWDKSNGNNSELVILENSDYVLLENCVVQNGIKGISNNLSSLTTINVYNINPYFVDLANNNFTVSDSSNCINAGANYSPAISSLLTHDINGNPRIFDDTEDIVDIGAYEFQGVITNRHPEIDNPQTINIIKSPWKDMVFRFTDLDNGDTHTLTVVSDNPNVTLSALSSQTNNAMYTIYPDLDWRGQANIILSVTDNHGAQDIDTFKLIVSDTVNYNIVENTVWNTDTVYIGSNCSIATDARLDIQPGTNILFLDNYTLDIKGIIKVYGVPKSKVVFTLKDTSGFSQETHAGWGGMRLSNQKDTSEFNHCIFEFVKDKCVIDNLEYSNSKITNCIFRNNISANSYSQPSVIQGQGEYAGIFVGNSLFYDNTTYYGPVSTSNSDIKLYNNIFFGNSGRYGMAYLAWGSATVMNCISWNNQSSDNYELREIGSKGIDISNCVFEHGGSSIYGSNISYKNIFNLYPQFVDTSQRNFRLQSNSSYINTGVVGAHFSYLNNADLDGNDRIYNGAIQVPDIGAYEYQGEPSNRPPAINETGDKTSVLGAQINESVNFTDADVGDTHTITITSDNVNVDIQNVSGDTTGSTYTLVPAPGYEGTAIISVVVEDNGGLYDSISYALQVNQMACGTIYNDMVWDADTINVVCDVIVEEDATLTINPGTKVIFNGPYTIDIYGVLKAIGADNDTIVFTLNDTIIFNDTVFTHAWRGIKIHSQLEHDTSEIKYCEISRSQDRGIEIVSKSITIISHSNIHHNLTTKYKDGGGIYLSTEKSLLENNFVHHNISADQGGGIFCTYGSRIKNNIVSYNSARFGGGIYTSSYSDEGSIIENNTIEYNKTTYSSGGGIYSHANDTIKNNIIRNNNSYSSAGGILGYQKCHIINNLIEGNICENTSYGGGIYLYAGNFDIVNNVIINNYAHKGSGILLSSVDGLVANNTISNNSSGSNGNAIFLGGEKSQDFVNNIIWGNKSPVSGSQIYIDNELAQPKISYCVVEGGKDNISCSANVNYTNEYEHNIDKYPYFADTVNNNFSLTDSSICINSGSPDTTGMNLPQIDIAGNPRIYNGAVDRIDIGAYEYNGEPVNRRPVLKKMEDITLLSSQTKQIKVEYIDTDFGDTHTLTVESNEPNLSIENLSGDTTRSTYDLVAAPGWQGSATVKVKVEDSQGLKDSVYYSVNVSDTVCGEITDNLIWDKDTVFVACDITIPAGKTLTILPGTVVLLMDNYEFHVNGTLIAAGTEQDRIVFIPKDTSISNPKNHWKGIYFHSYSSSADTSKLFYCDIQYGNVKIVRDKVIVSNCLFNKCSFTNGGGICVFNSSPLIEKSIFSNNSVSHTGGGISCIDDDYFDVYKTNPVIRGNEFFNNEATYGGAIYAGETGAIISNNIIHHNRASYGGAVYFYEYGNPILQNNLIYKNTAISYGGAICYDNCSRLYQVSNTIVKNKSGMGGALYVKYYSYPQIYNDIIYYNEASQSGSQVYILGSQSSPGFHYCFIEYGFDSIAGNGSGTEYRGVFNDILTAEPFFTDTASHNYQLSDSSYCINAGTMNTKNTQLPEYDIAGNARVYAGVLSNVDVGAYEFQGNPKNRKPIIDHMMDQYTYISTRKILSVYFTDVDKADVHTITITTNSINVTVENKSGDISGSTYELVPANEWEGTTEIYVRVEDDKGKYNIDTFNLFVSKYYCGSITQNTVWNADTIKIACDVTIEKGTTLTILPGTQIIFDEYACLRVLGRLLAVGTKEDRITFTSSDITGYPGETYKGWRGIRFYGPNNSETSQLEYCTIQYAKGINNGFVNDTYGGGLYIDDWSGILIANCQISDNSAVERGGGLYCNNSGARIINNIISNNNTGWSGGGLYTSGSYPNTYLINNVICNNLSDIYGGGISGRNIYSFNNLIVNNRANYGGGLEIDNGKFYNTIFWGNTAADNYPQLSAGYSSVYLFNSVLEGGLANIGYTSTVVKTYKNMIEQNPQFVLPSQGAGTDYNGLTANWSLRASSPCINMGTSNIDVYDYECPETDIEGESRIFMDSIDIGAYEFRNLPPYRIGNISNQQIPAGVNSTINISMEGIFMDDNIGDILTYCLAGDSIPPWINSSSAGTTLSIMASPSVLNTGSFQIIVKATDLFGESVTDTITVEVLPNQPPIVENALADIEIHALENLNHAIPVNSFVDPDENDILTYSAALEDGSTLPDWLSFSNQANTFTGMPQVADIGAYSIVVTATDMANYSVKDTFNIIVLDPSLISDNNFSNYKIYPLPANELIFIEFADNIIDKHNIEMFDINGKELNLKTSINNNKIEIDISMLPAGFYYLKVQENENRKVHKILIL